MPYIVVDPHCMAIPHTSEHAYIGPPTCGWPIYNHDHNTILNLIICHKFMSMYFLQLYIYECYIVNNMKQYHEYNFDVIHKLQYHDKCRVINITFVKVH